MSITGELKVSKSNLMRLKLLNVHMYHPLSQVIDIMIQNETLIQSLHVKKLLGNRVMIMIDLFTSQKV